MRSKLAGFALQLAGYALVFLGLGVAAAAFLVAGNFPATPLWAFLAGAVVLGAPLMLAGGLLYRRGLVRLGSPAEQVEAAHREEIVVFALFLGFLWLLGFLAAAPVFLWAIGLGKPNGAFVSAWFFGWVLVFGAARDWTTRPLWLAIEWRARVRLRPRK